MGMALKESTDRLNIKELSLKELEDVMVAMSQEPYRARQIWDWIYKKRVADFNLMTNLSKELRQRLQERFYISSLELVERRVSRDGTQKLCFRLGDHRLIESVWIKMEGHHTLCLSCQVGCRLGCSFCLTGKRGWVRNLSSAEIIDQILALQDIFHLEKGFNLVLMGMGEPLDNYHQVVKALRVITSPHGLAISGRRITLSTVGLIEPLRKLAQEYLPINLAVSLNATNEQTREMLMPINKSNPLRQLLPVLKSYPLGARRRITIQYVLIKGVNDSPEDAQRLVSLLRGIRCKVNLIPLNHIPDSPYQPPSPATIRQFQQILLANRLTALIRESRGSDIWGACGQLGSGGNN